MIAQWVAHPFQERWSLHVFHAESSMQGLACPNVPAERLPVRGSPCFLKVSAQMPRPERRGHYSKHETRKNDQYQRASASARLSKDHVRVSCRGVRSKNSQVSPTNHSQVADPLCARHQSGEGELEQRGVIPLWGTLKAKRKQQSCF